MTLRKRRGVLNLYFNARLKERMYIDKHYLGVIQLTKIRPKGTLALFLTDSQWRDWIVIFLLVGRHSRLIDQPLEFSRDSIR